MMHFHEYSQVFVSFLCLLETSSLAQTSKPAIKAQQQANSPVAAQPNAGPFKSASSGHSDAYKGYKFLIRTETSIVAGFAEYAEIGNAVRPSSGEGKSAAAGGGSQVPVTVPGSLVGSNGAVTLNCTPSTSNGREAGFNGKVIPGEAWTITLTCAIPYDKITLQRGVTLDPDFASWISGAKSGKSRDLTLEVADEIGKMSRGYRLNGCTVASAAAKTMPELEAGAHSTSIAAVELHCAAVQRY
jgi:hypothetical protein